MYEVLQKGCSVSSGGLVTNRVKKFNETACRVKINKVCTAVVVIEGTVDMVFDRSNTVFEFIILRRNVYKAFFIIFLGIKH